MLHLNLIVKMSTNVQMSLRKQIIIQMNSVPICCLHCSITKHVFFLARLLQGGGGLHGAAF